MPEIDVAIRSATLPPSRAPGADVTRLEIVSKRGNMLYECDNWWEIEQVGNLLFERSGNRGNCWGGIVVRELPDADHATRWKSARVKQMRGDLGYSAVRVPAKALEQPSEGGVFAQAVAPMRDWYTPSTHRTVWTDASQRALMVSACPQDDQEAVSAVLESIATGVPPVLTPVHAALLMVLLPNALTVAWLVEQLGPAAFIDAALEAVWWTHVHHSTAAFLKRMHNAYSVRTHLWMAIRQVLNALPPALLDEAHAHAANQRATATDHQRHLLALAFDDTEWAAEDMAALRANRMRGGAHLPLLGVLRSTSDLSECLRNHVAVGPSTLPSGLRWAPTTQDAIVRSVWPFVPLMVEHVGEAWVRECLRFAHKDRARWPDDIPSPPEKKPFVPAELSTPELPGSLDLTARDFRRVEPHEIERLYSDWSRLVVDGLVKHLKSTDQPKLAASLRRAYKKDAGPRDWEVGLYKWVVRARKEELPTTTHNLLGWFGNAMMQIIEGLHDGDYGTDSAMGLVALAHLLPLLGTDTGAWDPMRARAVMQQFENAERF